MSYVTGPFGEQETYGSDGNSMESKGPYLMAAMRRRRGRLPNGQFANRPDGVFGVPFRDVFALNILLVARDFSFQSRLY